jgi:hypothetical protein
MITETRIFYLLVKMIPGVRMGEQADETQGAR